MTRVNAHTLITTPDPPTGRKMLECDTHGSRPWQHHVMCDACGRVYQLKDADRPRHAPETCPCGERLLPADAPEVDFTSRPICYLCFRRVVQHAGGQVPPANWTPDRDYARKEVPATQPPNDDDLS